MSPRPLLIDCDPGVDDAIALMVALAAAEALDVKGIITVAGNVPLSLTEANARRICTLMGRLDIPVYAGCPRPLLRSPVTATDIHGITGLEGATLPEPGMPLQSRHGVTYLMETLIQAPVPVTLATLGPLTNLAIALIQAPHLRDHIAEVVVMGGGMARGNITPVAEFNIYADPHAAQVVFQAGLPLTLIGLDVTHQVLTTPERLERLRALGNPVSRVAADLLSHYGQRDRERLGLAGAPLHDPCIMAYLLQPELFAGFSASVTVETDSPLTLGQTVVNRRMAEASTLSGPKVKVMDRVDAAGVYDLILRSLARLPHP
jgi:purine nucleosidase